MNPKSRAFRGCRCGRRLQPLADWCSTRARGNACLTWGTESTAAAGSPRSAATSQSARPGSLSFAAPRPSAVRRGAGPGGPRRRGARTRDGLRDVGSERFPRRLGVASRVRGSSRRARAARRRRSRPTEEGLRRAGRAPATDAPTRSPASRHVRPVRRRRDRAAGFAWPRGARRAVSAELYRLHSRASRPLRSAPAAGDRDVVPARARSRRPRRRQERAASSGRKPR